MAKKNNKLAHALLENFEEQLKDYETMHEAANRLENETEEYNLETAEIIGRVVEKLQKLGPSLAAIHDGKASATGLEVFS